MLLLGAVLPRRADPTAVIGTALVVGKLDAYRADERVAYLGG